MYTCTGKLRTCVHLVLCVARLQYLSIDIDLNLLHQYPQTQPVVSKDKAKNLIRKPDTQKKPNLTPRRQSHPTDAQICVTRLPRGHKGTQLKPKLVPQGSPSLPRGHPRPARSRQVAQLKSRWVPPGSRRVSRETPKDTQNEPKPKKRDSVKTTMQNRIILMRKSRFSAQKHQKH